MMSAPVCASGWHCSRSRDPARTRVVSSLQTAAAAAAGAKSLMYDEYCDEAKSDETLRSVLLIEL